MKPYPILREAHRPYRSRRRFRYLAAFVIGTGIGAIVFFGWTVLGVGLIIGAAWLLAIE